MENCHSQPFQHSWKQLPLEQISSISVHKKDGILDYGGIGMRFSRKTKAYIFFADYVIEVEQGGKKLVFSTAKPKEFDAVISNWQTNKP